jgi:hypothetical protein
MALLFVTIGFLTLSASTAYNECVGRNGAYPTEQYAQDGQRVVEPAIAHPTPIRLFVYCGSVFANQNGDAFTGLATIALTIATIVLGYLAWDQSLNTRAQLRAYISILPQKMALDQDLRTVMVLINQENVGKTPAIKAQVYWRILPLVHPLKNAMVFNETSDEPMGPATAIVYPGKSHTPVRTFALTEEMIADLTCPACYVALYVYGRGKYRDIFGRKHSAEFCAFLDHPEFVRWLEEAKRKIGEPLAANFKFSEFNNTTT